MNFSRSSGVLDGLTGSLVEGTARALQIKPCLEKARCLRHHNKISPHLFLENIKTAWLQYGPADTNVRREVQQRVLRCLHSRHLGFSSVEVYLEQLEGKLAQELEDSYEEWVENLPSIRRLTHTSIARLLLLKKPVVSRLEVDWCTGISWPYLAPPAAWSALNEWLLRLLTEICIPPCPCDDPRTGKKCLQIKFTSDHQPILI